MNNCSQCTAEYGSRWNFIKGGLCKKCFMRTAVPVAIYTHDSVGDDDVYYHHFKFETPARCPGCGHVATTSRKACRELNGETAHLTETKTNTSKTP
jgi:hypothetical protein